jgi:hypothetical protein
MGTVVRLHQAKRDRLEPGPALNLPRLRLFPPGSAQPFPFIILIGSADGQGGSGEAVVSAELDQDLQVERTLRDQQQEPGAYGFLRRRCREAIRLPPSHRPDLDGFEHIPGPTLLPNELNMVAW